MSCILFDIVQKNNSPQSIRFRNNDGTLCLFDTGANFPVWCTGPDSLQVQYPDAYIDKDAKAIIKGFGGDGTISDVYCIPLLTLSDGKDNLCIKNLWVAVCKRDFECDLILNYPLFNLSNISIKTFTKRNEMHRIKPTLRIDTFKHELYAKNEYVEKDSIKYFRKAYCLVSEAGEV